MPQWQMRQRETKLPKILAPLRSRGPRAPRLDESNEAGLFVIWDGHGHSAGVDGVPELTACVTDGVGENFF